MRVKVQSETKYVNFNQLTNKEILVYYPIL